MFLKQLSKYKIILASQSPRRQFLLKDLGIDFECITKPNISEVYPENLKKEEIAIYLAKHKAKAYNNEIEDKTILITADTIVWINGEVLNKPIDYEDAQKMLRKLSAKKHSVITGVCLKSKSKTVSFSSITNVYFKELNSAEIEYYLKKYKPYDKAGSYGIQEWIGYIAIEKIEGSYFNVMGLPIHKLYEELSRFTIYD